MWDQIRNVLREQLNGILKTKYKNKFLFPAGLLITRIVFSLTRDNKIIHLEFDKNFQSHSINDDLKQCMIPG